MPLDIPPKAQQVEVRSIDVQKSASDIDDRHLEKMYLKRSTIFPTTNYVYGKIDPFRSQYGIEWNLNW